jgi:hypothetical protein
VAYHNGHVSIISTTLASPARVQNLLQKQSGPYSDGRIFVQTTFPAGKIWDNIKEMFSEI